MIALLIETSVFLKRRDREIPINYLLGKKYADFLPRRNVTPKRGDA